MDQTYCELLSGPEESRLIKKTINGTSISKDDKSRGDDQRVEHDKQVFILHSLSYMDVSKIILPRLNGTQWW